MHKVSLRVLDEKEEMQTVVTNQAMMFAELTLQTAKQNNLTREQVIKDAHWEPNTGRTGGRKLTVTTYRK